MALNGKKKSKMLILANIGDTLVNYLFFFFKVFRYFVYMHVIHVNVDRSFEL